MSLAGVIASVLFGVTFLIFFPSRHELFWDRVLLLLISLTGLFVTYKRGISPKITGRFLNITYYAHASQCILAVALNDFKVSYLLVLFITAQVSAYSFRKESSALFYLVYINVACILALHLLPNIPREARLLYMFFIIICSALQFVVTRVKCRFVRNMKMNEQLLKSLVAKTENSIFITDIVGTILDVNMKAVEMFGYSRKELISRDFVCLRKNVLSESEIEDGMNALQTDRFWISQTSLVKADGTEFPARIAIALIESLGSRYLIYRVQDITELKQNESLILEAKERAESAALVKSQFLAVMSHEIRTPLNGVIATASLLQQSEMSREQAELTDTIMKSGQSLMMLINDILEFSKMESGKMRLDPRPCVLNDVVFEVADLLRPHAVSKGLEIEVRYDSKIPRGVILDDHRLRQVLLNLIGNGIKFTNQGKITIECENLEVMHNRYHIGFKISDTGIGIPEDKKHLLFQSFSQMDASTSRRYGGTGLGLAISKQLIELMGGQILISSEVGKGTTFSFQIWTDECSDQLLKNGNAAPELSENLNAGLRNDLRIMVAEDNLVNKQVMQFMLEKLGLKADYAENGLVVLELHNKNEYDLIFMDMQMPEMDGVIATKEIRAGNRNQPLIIGISANAFTEDRILCEKAGMNDFLPKPFDLAQLKGIILKWQDYSNDKIHSAA